MNAVLKSPELITARAGQRPTYRRWDLVKLRERNQWIEANRDLLTRWYRETGTYADHDDGQVAFAVFADIQFDIEHAHFEELREDAKLDHNYVDRED